MQLLSYFKMRPPFPLLSQSYGWTGIEIGCHVIQLAQVCKINDSWQLSAVWSLKHPLSESSLNESSPPPSDETFGWISREEMFEKGLSRTIEEAENLKSLFRGHQCAATLTDGMIAYRELDLPSGLLSEAKAMVGSEVALDAELEIEELVTDSWSLPQNSARSVSHSFGAVSLKKCEAYHVADTLLGAGFECQILDAVPCAMARATSMADPSPNTSTLAIDLGYQRATLTLVKSGRPLLTREIRNLGLLALIERVADAFEISKSDAQTLLLQSSNGGTADRTESRDVANPVHQHRSSFLQLLTNEIVKTTQYCQKAFRTDVPTQTILMGAGTRMSNVEQCIADRTCLPTHAWQIDRSPTLLGDHNMAVYAIAAGLSSLAWEAQ